MKIRHVALVITLISSMLMVLSTTQATTNPENTWQTKTPMPTPRAGLNTAVVDGKIYAIGGTNATGQLPSISPESILGNTGIGNFVGTNEEYDPAADNWTTKTDMPTPRALFATAVYQNKIYCFGGRSTPTYLGGPTNATEVYDPTTDTWTTKADMPIAQQWLQANIVNNKIYLIGGEPNRTLNQVYDPQTDTWTNKTAIPSPESMYASAVTDNKIYILGGYPSSLNQIYNPTANTWSTGTTAPSTIVNGAAQATTGEFTLKRIYLFGYSNSYIYNPTTDNWAKNTVEDLKRANFATVNIDDTIFIIGGYTYTLPLGNFAPTGENEQFTPAEYGTPDPSYQPPTPTHTPTPTPTQTPTPQPTNTTQPTQTNQQTTTPTPTTTPNNLDFWQTTTLWTTTTITIAAAASIAAIIVLLKKQHKTPSDTLARLSTPTIKQQI